MNVFCELLQALLLLSWPPVTAQAQKRSFKDKLVSFLDSSNVKNTDPRYIGLPEKKWRVILSSSTDQMDLRMDTHAVEFYQDTPTNVSYDFHLQVKPPVANAIGLWAGYRGWGAGYSVSVSGNKGINMSFNIATPSNGVNIRVHRFEADKMVVGIRNISVDGKVVADVGESNMELEDPGKVESFVFDGYWIFNKKRFSLAAAYDQSTRQLRSAGSLIAGAMFYYQKLDFSQKKNFALATMSNHVAQLKIHQGSLGLGYTYNWVPARGWIVNAVAMPVVSLYNRVKCGTYSYQLIPSDDDDPLSSLDMEYNGDEIHHGSVKLNLDTRVALSYWWRDWFFCLMGQGHRFLADYPGTTVKMVDWNIKASVGLMIK